MITEFGGVIRQNEAVGYEEDGWKMDNVAGWLLVNICEMGISSLEMRCYSYKVHAKYMERAAWAEVRRRMELCDKFIHREDPPVESDGGCSKCGTLLMASFDLKADTMTCVKCGHTTEIG